MKACSSYWVLLAPQKFIDPREGERLIPIKNFTESNNFCRVLTLSRRAVALPNALILRTSSHIYVGLDVPDISFGLNFYQYLWSAQPLIIQQIIDKVIGHKHQRPLFSGVMLIGVSILSNILNPIRTFLFTDTPIALILPHPVVF